MKIGAVWKILFAWFLIVIIIFFIAKEYSVALFGLIFVFFGGVLPFIYREKVRTFFRKLKLNTFFGFFLIVFTVATIEETICYLLGNKIAYPVLWIDIPLVFFIWIGWFGAWYFWISKKYYF